MKSAYQRICRLLASSGYHDRDIAEFLDELLKAGPMSAIKDIGDIRRTINMPSSNRAFDVPTHRFVPPQSDTASKIERLLVRDAGMPRAIAIERLSNELRIRFPDLQVPPESRKGFHLWIRRLAMLVPEKELLHIATNIRNRSVHDSPTDWRLK